MGSEAGRIKKRKGAGAALPVIRLNMLDRSALRASVWLSDDILPNAIYQRRLLATAARTPDFEEFLSEQFVQQVQLTDEHQGVELPQKDQQRCSLFLRR